MSKITKYHITHASSVSRILIYISHLDHLFIFGPPLSLFLGIPVLLRTLSALHKRMNYHLNYYFIGKKYQIRYYSNP